ncbi:MAG TPA: branched-chain amino acid ABC transporter ATP-binding protein/permease [Gemmatimonadaceae bacterium]|nr:branched-chain amino acid ABC transporter ATP-binding protein/permease [Gemmatimonadaceae bacterium]
MMPVLRTGLNAPLLAGVALLVAWPFVFGSSYDLRVFTLAGIFAILVLGYQFIFGHAGALALTQGTFFGLGAYVTGLLGINLGWGFGLTLPLSVLGPLLLALLVAVPVLRLEAHYFALATLGISQVMLLIAISWESLTGGANGLPGVPGVIIFGEALPRGLPLAAFVWALVALAAFASWQITRGLLGRAFTVMRENEIAAVSIGIDIWRLRLVAFLLSAGYAGVAGALYVHTVRVISPDVLEFHVMVAVITMAVVGGRTRVAGAILGAFLLVHLPEWFRFLGQFYLIAYGAILLGMIIAAPYGLIGAAERFRAQWFPEPIPLPPLPAASTRGAETLPSGPLLEVKSLAIAFGGVHALEEVSLSIERGEIFGLIGPNGSGKTTLINCITGIYAPASGGIVFGGRDITRLAPFEIARLGVARTFQNINLVDDMTALDNVAAAYAGRRWAGISPELMRARGLDLARQQAMRLLEQLDVGPLAMQPCGGLAYGLKRRVEIARALALEPRLLLLDEPAAGLNQTEQADLAVRLRKLSERGLTLLVIEHNMPFLMPLATRMACLDYGRMIAAGSPGQIRADSRVIEAYLGAPEVA